MKDTFHIPVLLSEVVENLNLHEGITYLDGTIGFAGHFSQIYEFCHHKGDFYGFDQDAFAFNFCSEKYKNNENVHIFYTNFKNFDFYIPKIINFDAVLLDLGVSSFQLDETSRGFSYHYDAPLDMRMNQSQELSAKTIVNEWSKEELIHIFKQYGECSKAVEVAQKICERRKIKLLETTFQLRDLIYAVFSSNNLNRKNPVKQFFQALRIAVNDEINVLKSSLEKLANRLKPHGRLAVITFHSLEEKIVKTYFQHLSQKDQVLITVPGHLDEPKFTFITKKAILPSKQELVQNPRSHSAKLFVLEKK